MPTTKQEKFLDTFTDAYASYCNCNVTDYDTWCGVRYMARYFWDYMQGNKKKITKQDHEDIKKDLTKAAIRKVRELPFREKLSILFPSK